MPHRCVFTCVRVPLECFCVAWALVFGDWCSASGPVAPAWRLLSWAARSVCDTPARATEWLCAVGCPGESYQFPSPCKHTDSL